MNNGATYFKWSVIALIAVAAILFYRGCFTKPAQTVVKTKYDTLYVNHRDTVFFDNPVPYKVEYVKEKVLHDTLESTEYIMQHVDSARILQQYFATRLYDTTVSVQYGSARVKGVVTQNRVTSFGLSLNQNIPEVTKTVTLTQPKKFILYAGIFAIGNKQNLPYASGLSLDLKLRNDFMFGGGALLTKDNGVMYMAEIKAPIRLRK